MVSHLKIYFNLVVFILLHISSHTAYSEDDSSESISQEQDYRDGTSSAGSAGESKGVEGQEASSVQVRRFHEVLDELLAEFGYDVKQGQIKGLKNVAIRKVAVSESLPRSYGQYLELLVAERIRENSRIRLISCLPCKTKTSRIIDGKLVITSPNTNMAEMSRAAEQLGIENFLDVVLVYHTTHMVLAFQVFDTTSKEMVMVRTYNSETIKSRFQKLAIDYSQVAKSRAGDEYKPSWRYMVGGGAASIPNVAGGSTDQSMATLSVRATEKFDNRNAEFGLALSIYYSSNQLMGAYPSGNIPASQLTPAPWASALGIYGLYAHNFLGTVESYRKLRHGINGGVGMLVTSGYLASTVKLGWDMFFGKKFSTTIGAVYVNDSEIYVDSAYQKTKGGTGGELVMSYNF